MATLADAAKSRWKKLPNEERRRRMMLLVAARRDKQSARVLAASIARINAVGGMAKAVARVKAAGVQLEAAS